MVLIRETLLVYGVNTGNVKSEWKCLFNCSDKYMVETHSQNKFSGVSSDVLQ